MLQINFSKHTRNYNFNYLQNLPQKAKVVMLRGQEEWSPKASCDDPRTSECILLHSREDLADALDQLHYLVTCNLVLGPQELDREKKEVSREATAASSKPSSAGDL